MPWTVTGEIESGPVALTLTAVLPVPTVTVEPLVARWSLTRLRAAADHAPDALVRHSRESLTASTILLGLDAAVLATAVSLPQAAVGLAPVEPAAAWSAASGRWSR